MYYKLIKLVYERTIRQQTKQHNKYQITKTSNRCLSFAVLLAQRQKALEKSSQIKILY